MKTISRGLVGAPIFLTLTLHAATTFAAPTVVINKPAAGAAVPDTLNLEVGVTSPLLIDSVSAKVQGITAPLTAPPNSFYVGQLDLSTVPIGPIVVDVTATDVVAGSTTVSVNLVHDHAPVLDVLTVEGYVARPSIRLHATCADVDLYGCATVSAKIVDGPVLASANGTTLDQNVSLAAYVDKSLAIEFTATDAAGLTATRVLTTYVDTTPRLRELAHVEGPIIDFDADRILFGTPGGLVIRSRTGALPDVVIANVANPAFARRRAFLTPLGAIWYGGELRNGTRLGNNAEFSLVARGGYAVWTTAGTEANAGVGWFRNVTTDTTVAAVSGYAVPGADVTSAGDAVFGLIPTGSTRAGISTYRAGTVTALATSSKVSQPITDGINVVYAHQVGVGRPGINIFTDSESELARWQNLGTALVGRDYQVANGWTAFTDAPTMENYTVFTRSPDGTIAPGSPYVDASVLDALSDNGELMYFLYGAEFGRYQGRAGGGLGTRITNHHLGRSVPVGTDWYIVMGASLFQVGDPVDLDAGTDAGDWDAGDLDAATSSSGGSTSSASSSGGSMSSASSSGGSMSSASGSGGMSSGSGDAGASGSSGSSGTDDADGGGCSAATTEPSSWLGVFGVALGLAGVRRASRRKSRG